MKLKIISNGTDLGTKVVDAETGSVVEGVTSIEWKIAAGKYAEATIKCISIPVEVEIDGKNGRLIEYET